MGTKKGGCDLRGLGLGFLLEPKEGEVNWRSRFCCLVRNFCELAVSLGKSEVIATLKKKKKENQESRGKYEFLVKFSRLSNIHSRRV